MRNLKKVVKEFLLREEFDAGSAFNFIRQKEGRALPREYVLSVLKKRDISNISIPEDLGDDKELWQIYKFVHAPETLTEEDLDVKRDLDLNGCTSLQSLPEGLSVDGSLWLNGCTSLQSLPQELSVSWSLHLNGCTSLRELPQGLSVVRGSLWLKGCTSLRELPQGLFVDWGLFLNDCTSLRELPQGLFVGGSLYFSKTDPIPQKFGGDKNAIRKYIEQELGGDVKGEIRNLMMV